MSLRTRSFRPWLWSVALVALFAAPVSAQPPSPLELVRGLREHGHTELAMEYLKHLEGDATLSPDDKAAIGLERAKCLLEASEDEPDEGTRQGMVAEAKEGLNAFILNAGNHPRAVEALLAQAKLTSLDAKEQLGRARRMEIPGRGEDGREAAAKKQLAEAARARPLFGLAAKRFAEASDKLRVKLEDKGIDPITRKMLDREAFEAELASGINQFNISETYLPDDVLSGTEKEDRNKALVAAKDIFTKLGKGPNTNRTVWVGRAWAAEVTFEQDDFNTAAAEVTAILRAPFLEAEDGKRLARFFHLRRTYAAALAERSQPKVTAVVTELRNWLTVYGGTRKPTPEVFAVRYYLARSLHVLAESSIVKPKNPEAPVVINATARGQLTEAERLYRALAQADHDFTARAARQRMAVVRRLLGDADQPPSAYDTFEKAQMAALIKMSLLAAEEAKSKPDPKKVEDIRFAAIALLQRSRELATPQDNPADVTDVLLRLLYFYHITGQPEQAAVLGEHVAHTIKSTGGKAALAGLLGLNGYVIASNRAKGGDAEAAAAARKADRERAMALARFLDEKYPNDNATDSARYRLGSMLVDERRFTEAFEVLLKVRPSYSEITEVRLLEGYVAGVLVRVEEGKPALLPPEKRAEVFKRAVADLAKVAKPVSVAPEKEVRNYLSARCRLALLLFGQGRADPAAEKANPGYNQAFAIAEDVIASVPSYDNMLDPKTKKLNLDGLEMTMLARDAHARAVYLRAHALIKAGNLDEAAKTLQPTLDAVTKDGPVFNKEMEEFANAGGEEDGPQKAKIAKLAEGVDRTRVEVILAGFRLKVKQGKAAEASAMLDLIPKSGGTIEGNLPLLELMGRELAAQMTVLKKEGKKKEADDLGAGLAELLTKITALPKLTPPTLLFVGQTLVTVGQYDKGIETLRKIPEPEFKDWRTTTPEKMRARVAELKKQMEAIENDVIKTLPAEDQRAAENPELRAQVVEQKVVPALKGKPGEDYAALKRERFGKDGLETKLAALPMGLEQRFPGQIRDYAIAQLGIARGLRESKKFAEGEQLLTSIIGTVDKPGWGSGRLYYRKELATLYEEKGATIMVVKDANTEWGKALREWTTLFGIHKARLQKPPAGATPGEMIDFRNAYADAYFEIQRCVVKANQQLLNPKDATQGARLQKTFEDVAKRFVEMEKLKEFPMTDWHPDVQHRYADLLKEVPQVMAAYKANGGKAFLERAPNP